MVAGTNIVDALTKTSRFLAFHFFVDINTTIITFITCIAIYRVHSHDGINYEVVKKSLLVIIVQS